MGKNQLIKKQVTGDKGGGEKDDQSVKRERKCAIAGIKTGRGS